MAAIAASTCGAGFDSLSLCRMGPHSRTGVQGGAMLSPSTSLSSSSSYSQRILHSSSARAGKRPSRTPSKACLSSSSSSSRGSNTASCSSGIPGCRSRSRISLPSPLPRGSCGAHGATSGPRLPAHPWPFFGPLPLFPGQRPPAPRSVRAQAAPVLSPGGNPAPEATSLAAPGSSPPSSSSSSPCSSCSSLLEGPSIPLADPREGQGVSASTIVAESEEERRACALMRAQLLYPYPVPLHPSPPASAHRDADVLTSIHSQLDSRTKAEYSRDSTLKQLGLPVLSFLVLSSSDHVMEDAQQRQHLLLQHAHPARKPLLACPELPLPLARRSAWHQWQNTNQQHVAQQQHELLRLHNGVSSRALALATLDLQLPGGPGDLPLGPSESMRVRKIQQQKQQLQTQKRFPDKFSAWLSSSRPTLEQLEREAAEEAAALATAAAAAAEEEEEEEQGAALRGGYIFNLCVAQLFRRQGIARRLLSHVAAYARDVQGLDCLRMHAECANTAAVTLYSSLGFEVEHEETEKEAAALRRPRRVLFRLTF